MIRLLILFVLLRCSLALGQDIYFPPVSGNTWDTISVQSLGWCPDRVDSLYKYLENHNSKAFILLKDGKIVLEQYFGTFSKDSAWYWASAGKSLTAFLVGLAQEDGLLSIDDTSSDYLGTGWTNCSSVEEEKITIRHQLSMSTGLDDGVADHFCTLDTCLNCIADPGTRWAYHNGPYTLLDPVIESATGNTLNAFFYQKLNQIGMTGAFIQLGYNRVFFSTARSMARFGLLVQNKGTWNNQAIMSDTVYFQSMLNSSQSMNPSYGYLWWLNGKSSFMLPSLQFQFAGSWNPSAPSDLVAALGKNGQMLNISNMHGLVWLRMGDNPDVGEVPALFNDTVWQKLNEVMCNLSLVSEESVSVPFRVFPNPAQESLFIEGPNENYSWSLIDLTGRTWIEQKGCYGKMSIELESHLSGIYFIRLTTVNGLMYYQRLILQ